MVVRFTRPIDQRRGGKEEWNLLNGGRVDTGGAFAAAGQGQDNVSF